MHEYRLFKNEYFQYYISQKNSQIESSMIFIFSEFLMIKNNNIFRKILRSHKIFVQFYSPYKNLNFLEKFIRKK